MITRRAFLSALAALPLVGRWMEANIAAWPTPVVFDPWVPMTVTPSEGGGEIFITNGDQGYVFKRDHNWPSWDTAHPRTTAHWAECNVCRRMLNAQPLLDL